VASQYSLHFIGRTYAEIVDRARDAFPRECCGVLAGTGNSVERVFPVANVAPAPETRYEMAPVELWDARRRATAEGLEVVGFYHSHPISEPRPSTYDIQRAYYPEAVYVIVGVEPEPRIRAFRIALGCVYEITITFGTAQTA